jgi:GxxExxY protein
VPYARQVELPIEYDGLRLDCGYRADIIVADTVILEIKSIDRILPIHEAQLLTYLRISQCRIGLLINFNTTSLKNGLRRCVL